MSRIDEMIRELCPEGVEMVKLKDVCNTVTPPTKLKTNEYQSEGEYVIIDQGLNAYAGFTNNEDALLPLGEYVLYGDHTCSVKYINEPFAQGADGLKILKANNIECKYLYYAICVYNLDNTEYKRHWTQAKEIIIPLPPLSIQQEIVSVLDSFTTLIDKMKQEVEKRKKQMEYYREELLSPKADYEVKTLGELGTFTRGNGLQKTDFTEEGYPCIHYGQIHTYYGTSTYSTKSFCDENFAQKLRKAKTGDLLIATTSEDVEACCKATVWLGEGEVAFSGDSYCYSHNQNPKYIAYLFQSEMFAKQKRMVAKGAKVVRVTGESMTDFSFCIPSLTKQSSIVSTLDKFESYISKLEKMIALRQKQYEYYREQLLTFE